MHRLYGYLGDRIQIGVSNHQDFHSSTAYLHYAAGQELYGSLSNDPMGVDQDTRRQRRSLQ